MCIIEGTKSFVVSRSICDKLDMHVVSRWCDISWKCFATEGFNFSFSTIGHSYVIVRAQDIGMVFYIKLKTNEVLIRMNHRIVLFVGWTTVNEEEILQKVVQTCMVEIWKKGEWSLILYLDCDDDVRTDCRKLCPQQQLFPGTRSLGWSNYTKLPLDFDDWGNHFSLHPQGKLKCVEWWMV